MLNREVLRWERSSTAIAAFFVSYLVDWRWVFYAINTTLKFLILVRVESQIFHDNEET